MVSDEEQSTLVALLNKDRTEEPVSDTQDMTEGAEKTSSSEMDSSASSGSKKSGIFNRSGWPL